MYSRATLPAEEDALGQAHHAKSLRTGKPERTRLSSMVDGDLNIRKKFRCVLDFIDEDRELMKLQK